MGAAELGQVRRIALALPEVSERLSHGAVCFFVRGRRPLCYLHDDHRGDGRVSLWCPSAPAVQEELTSAEPRRFFRPQASASGTFSHWIGIYLDLPGDDGVDWDEIAEILGEAYRIVAPRRLVALLDDPDGRRVAGDRRRQCRRQRPHLGEGHQNPPAAPHIP